MLGFLHPTVSSACLRQKHGPHLECSPVLVYDAMNVTIQCHLEKEGSLQSTSSPKGGSNTSDETLLHTKVDDQERLDRTLPAPLILYSIQNPDASDSISP